MENASNVEKKATDLSAQTPFVIYESGTPRWIANTIYDSADSTIEMFTKQSPDDAFADLRGRTQLVPHRLHDADSSAVWMTYFELFLTRQGDDTPTFAARLEMLRCMTQKPPEKAWASLGEYVLSNVDELSGWTSSHIRVLSEREQVFRRDDGLYYRYLEDGTLCQVIGEKTLHETRLDFITTQVLWKYGNIRQSLELFSWFATSADFEQNSAAYPKYMKASLWEPKWRRLQHDWLLQHWDRTRTVKWRPNSNLCDPDWLAADLLGHVTDTLKIDGWQRRIAPSLENPTMFGEQYDRQLDCVLDCHLRIGNDDEFMFQFGGRQYRWLNGSPEADTVISVAMTKDEDSAKVEEELNHLLTVLSWEHSIAIARRTGSGIISARRPLPWTSGVRSSMGLLVEPQWLFRTDVSKLSPEKWLAMALFREALNARSVFYEFLNYWKAIEVAFPKVPIRRTWIDSTVDKLHFEQERIAEIKNLNASVADYLYSDSRCAIAHVGHDPFVNPDASEDSRRLARDAHIVKDLAKLAIQQMP
jgi:hypothetical protein